ncbi:hypothetical protein QBZ16_001289 [Prototheca wickerhamii]|uniref:Protein kinase domain-containing protein n=1 Tax=Prototheca wickerhamii TaxID=3111 RepID=A0AAD9IDJ6_PROWI|nr:hypothetical protein QBZ16_001289 [Prototheca wickerhamii]
MVEARYSHAGTCFAAEGSFPGLVKSPPAITGERSTETPRNPEDAVVKVLLVTEARRSHSVINPDLFQYHNHFEFLRLIGKTANSEVFCVRHRTTNELFAVKRLRRRFRSKLQRERCLREVRAVAALPFHPNIVSQYRAWQEGGHFHIQMDLCQGGTLLELLNRRCLDEAALWQVVWDVSRGLAFLHESSILHLDIKPENIYRDLAGAWRIGDFGLAVANESRDWEEGDGDYVAPELLRGCEPTPAADMFSLGASLFQCATGRKLPREPREAETPGQSLLPAGEEGAIARLPLALRTLLRSLLRVDPRARPSAAHVLEEVVRQGLAGFDRAALQATAASPRPVYYDAAAAAAAAATEERCETPVGGAGATADGEFSFGLLPRAPSMVEPMSAPLARHGSGAPERWAPERWAPSLSPLISEGALTPGSGLPASPEPLGSINAEADEEGLPSAPARRRPSLPPLQIPGARGEGEPRAAGAPMTGDSSGGSFCLRRRDMPSPDSCDFGASSGASSDCMSYSCDTSTTVGCDLLEFMDTVERGEEGDSAASPARFVLPDSPPAFQTMTTDAEATDDSGEARGSAPHAAACRSFWPLPTPPRSSLAWDLYASPEFVSQLPPGSCGDSDAQRWAASDADGSGGLVNREPNFALRRFPTLDSIGALQPVEDAASKELRSKAGLPSLAARRPLLHSLSCQSSPLAPHKGLPAEAGPEWPAVRAGVGLGHCVSLPSSPHPFHVQQR